MYFTPTDKGFKTLAGWQFSGDLEEDHQRTADRVSGLVGVKQKAQGNIRMPKSRHSDNPSLSA
jgi:hypothetical protein